MPGVTVRPEAAADRDAIRALLAGAFPSAAEADLVETLRRDGDLVLGLVAEDAGAVAGVAVFSQMRAPFAALALAPVAVAERYRRRGIAARLIRDGLARAAREGWEGVFVLGDPGYYARFGFDAALARGFESPYAGPYLMALALAHRGLPARAGAVEHAPAFDAPGKEA